MALSLAKLAGQKKAAALFKLKHFIKRGTDNRPGYGIIPPDPCAAGPLWLQSSALLCRKRLGVSKIRDGERNGDWADSRGVTHHLPTVSRKHFLKPHFPRPMTWGSSLKCRSNGVPSSQTWGSDLKNLGKDHSELLKILWPFLQE